MTTDNVAEMMPEQLRDELAATKRVAQLWFHKAMKRKKELAQARAKLAAAIVTDRNRKLTQARAELKDLRGANREYGRQLADMTENREFWYKEAQDAEAEVKQLQTDLKLNAKMLADQCDQARETENKATVLRRQLAGMEAGRDFWRREYGRNVKRLATLDAAEAALADCGIGGIYDTFNGLPDAIKQMAESVKEMTGNIEFLVEQLTEAEQEAKQQKRQIDLMSGGKNAERQLRQEAERCHKAALTLAASREARLDAAEHRAEDLEQEWDDVHQALNECQVPRDYPDGTGASCRTRIFWLNQRAERAEALAQLVTPELAALLDDLVALAESTDVQVPALLRNPMLRTIDEARELATRIKEALDDSQA